MLLELEFVKSQAIELVRRLIQKPLIATENK